MNGQKVVKVFCHEEAAQRDFDKVNDDLFHNAEQANIYSNMLMPVLGNIGNVLYVAVAIFGGAMLMTGAPNLSISGMAFSISIVVPFLNMTKQFCRLHRPGFQPAEHGDYGLGRHPAYFQPDGRKARA